MVIVATFTSIINQLLPEPHAGLLSGILFGTKATLSKELTDALITTGTLHIVALSGTNITILTGIINFSLLWLVGRRWASALTILLITGFIWFVGPSASVIRAGIMGGISLLAIIFGRQTWGLLAWMLAVSTMLLLNPAWISDLSFQLSAMATLGIILFGGRKEQGAQVALPEVAGEAMKTSAGSPDGEPTKFSLASLFGDGEPEDSKGYFSEDGSKFSLATSGGASSGVFHWIWSLIRENLHLTLAAQVFTIPIIFWYFHRVSLISPIANVLIGWLIQPLTVVGLVVAIAGWIFLPLGQVIAWGAWVGLQYLLTVVMLLSKVPGASIGSP
ncbi:ComEC/Rec2 family competence protein [Candidatus Gottesmanbacteria bacterium]|nr:ComEC/Rec2 family competence protein [Candidatus Gottesmanbacteria bacterium]